MPLPGHQRLQQEQIQADRQPAESHRPQRPQLRRLRAERGGALDDRADQRQQNRGDEADRQEAQHAPARRRGAGGVERGLRVAPLENRVAERLRLRADGVHVGIRARA